jgi:hypothetical protein
LLKLQQHQQQQQQRNQDLQAGGAVVSRFVGVSENYRMLFPMFVSNCWVVDSFMVADWLTLHIFLIEYLRNPWNRKTLLLS